MPFHRKDRSARRGQFKSAPKTWLFVQASLLRGGASENLVKRPIIATFLDLVPFNVMPRGELFGISRLTLSVT